METKQPTHFPGTVQRIALQIPVFFATFGEHLLSIFCVLSSREERGVQRRLRHRPLALGELTA